MASSTHPFFTLSIMCRGNLKAWIDYFVQTGEKCQLAHDIWSSSAKAKLSHCILSGYKWGRNTFFLLIPGPVTWPPVNHTSAATQSWIFHLFNFPNIWFIECQSDHNQMNIPEIPMFLLYDITGILVLCANKFASNHSYLIVFPCILFNNVLHMTAQKEVIWPIGSVLVPMGAMQLVSDGHKRLQSFH